MKDFYLIWHIANFGALRPIKVSEETSVKAVEKYLSSVKEDFKKRATIYVYKDENCKSLCYEHKPT